MLWRLCVPGIFLLAGACNEAPTTVPSTADHELSGAPVIHKRVARNTIDPTGAVTGNGHHVIVTGPILCTAGELAELRATVTQRTTGAVAEGRGRITCTGADQTWKLRLEKAGRESFQEGEATAVAIAVTLNEGKATDAQQWLVNVMLNR